MIFGLDSVEFPGTTSLPAIIAEELESTPHSVGSRIFLCHSNNDKQPSNFPDNSTIVTMADLSMARRFSISGNGAFE